MDTYHLTHSGSGSADDITWTLLPLAARTPSDKIRSLRVDGDVKSAQVVEDFLRDLRQIIGKAESLGADMGRIAIVQEINLQSGKKISRADLEVAINQGAPTTIVQRKVDPNDTHVYGLAARTPRRHEVCLARKTQSFLGLVG